MKILWLRPTTGKNVSTRRERIAEHLCDRGIDIEIVDSSGLDSLTAVRAAVFGNHDLIIGNVRVGLYIGFFLALVLRKPFIGDVSDPIEQIEFLPYPAFRFFQTLEWWILERTSVAFFVETDSFEEAKRRNVNAIWAPNSVNYERFAEPSDEVIETAERVLRESGVDLSKPIAMYAGTLTTGIHLPELAEAATQTPGWEFVFLGEERGTDIASLSHDAENLYFPGSFDHELVPGFFAHAAAGIALVDVEQPQKILEYGAAALPTLAYPGRLKRRFTDEQLYFVEPKPAAIAATLQQISSAPDDAQARAEQLQAYAREHRWESVAERYYEQITALVSAR